MSRENLIFLMSRFEALGTEKLSEERASASSVRTKVSTGYDRLDEALQGGFLHGSAVVLCSPASDEIPLLIRNFLMAPHDKREDSLLVCRSLASKQALPEVDDHVKFLVCGENVPPARDVMTGKGIENLTELNLQISEALKLFEPKRILLDVLSDVLLRHKALQTRKWVSDLLTKLRAKEITTLAILNPNMHTREEVEAIIDLFDGNLEILETVVDGRRMKNLRISWMHGLKVAEQEFALQQLATEIQARTEESPAPGSVALKEPRWLTPLVNRVDETSKLKNAFGDVLALKSYLVALQGEAGVGKTRLIRELAIYAQSKGALVLTGRATEESFSYAPWVELLREYVGRTPGELLRKKLGANISEFAALIPDIAAKVGTVPATKPIEEQQERIRLFEAVSQFLVSISKENPLLLLLDDAHWADQASLDLLEYVVRSTRGSRVMTVCCYRSEDVGPNSPIYRTLMKLNRDRLLETILVKNLSSEDTANLIAQIFGEQRVSPEFTDLVFQRTNGNAFFVEEILRSLFENGTIFRSEKGWDRKPIHEISLPESVKATLRSRLTKLEKETLDVLSLASVIGPEFEFEVLREVSQTEEELLLERLEKALSAGLVQEVLLEKNAFRFADNRIRELLLNDLSQIRRTRYHLKTAEAMERIYAKNLERQAAVIAKHSADGGDVQRGLKYSIMAGDRNKAIHAYEQAINEYKRALDLIDIETSDPGERAKLLEKLADCYRFAGLIKDSVQCYREAIGVFEKLQDRTGCLRACLGLSATTVFDTGAREATLVLKQGLNYLTEEETDTFLAASIYAELARFLGVMDEWNEATAWADKALEVGERVRNFAAVAVGLSIKGSFLTDTGKIDEGLPLWERSLDVSLQNEQYEQAFFALNNLAIYTYPRDLNKAREYETRLLGLALRINHVVFQSVALSELAYFDCLRGDWRSSMDEVQKSLEIREKLSSPSALIPVSYRGRLLLGMGDLEGAEADIERALKLLKEFPKITLVVNFNLAMGILRLEQGRVEDAIAHLETCVDSFRAWEFTTAPLEHIETLLHLTSIYCQRGDLQKAHDMSQWATRLATQLRNDPGMAMALQAQAIVLCAQNDRKTGLENYSKCLTLWEKAGWPFYLAKALVGYSDLIASEAPDESRRNLVRASEIFEKLGAKRDLETAKTKLSRK